jgi:hypothetical protein
MVLKKHKLTGQLLFKQGTSYNLSPEGQEKKRMRMRIVLIVLLISFPIISAAQTTAYMVIFSNSKSITDANSTILKWQQSNLNKMFKGHFPQVYKSDTIKNLNPGFYIGVAGICESFKNAQGIQYIVNKEFPGSYIRKVSVPHGTISCPEIVQNKSRVLQGCKVDRNIVFSDKGTNLQWQILSCPNNKCQPDDWCSDKVIQVVSGKEVIDEIKLEADVCDGDDCGSISYYKFCDTLNIFKRKCIIMSSIASWDGGDIVENEVYTFRNGRITNIFNFMGDHITMLKGNITIKGEIDNFTVTVKILCHEDDCMIYKYHVNWDGNRYICNEIED